MQITIQRKKYLAWELSRHTTLDNLVYNQSNTCVIHGYDATLTLGTSQYHSISVLPCPFLY